LSICSRPLAQQGGKTAGQDGVIVAPFDTELFGHWWFEGADFQVHAVWLLAPHAVIAVRTPGAFRTDTPCGGMEASKGAHDAITREQQQLRGTWKSAPSNHQWTEQLRVERRHDDPVLAGRLPPCWARVSSR